MYCTRTVTQDLLWIGGSDRRTPIFEGAYPVPRGMSYNSYLLLDEKTVVFDTVDRAIQGQFFENLEHALSGRGLDYIFLHHMEPDHAATLGELLLRYPGATVVCTAKAAEMIGQFFGSPPAHLHAVGEGDSLETGRHRFTFLTAPMVHWPEVMVSYDHADHTLFSADAFGVFGALGGVLFADEVDFDRDWLDEARRYYTNIVGKYGLQVSTLLGKAAKLEPERICPLHGPVWRKDLGYITGKYAQWAAYESEEKGVLIAVSSVYGNTLQAAEFLACRLAEAGVKTELYDLSVTHPSYVLAQCFRFSHLVFASTTHNGVLFPAMDFLLRELKEHGLRARKAALIQNGSWAPTSGRLMTQLLEGMKDMELLAPPLTLKSALAAGQDSELLALAQALIGSVREG